MSHGVFIERTSMRTQIPQSAPVNSQLLVSSAALSKNAKMTVSEEKRQTTYAATTAQTGSYQRMESSNYPLKQLTSSHNNNAQTDHASNTSIPHSKQALLHQQLLNHAQLSTNQHIQQQSSSQQSSSSPYSRSNNNTAAFGSLTRNTSSNSNGSNNNTNHHPSSSFQQKQQTSLAQKQQQQYSQQLLHRRNQTNMENVAKNQQFLEYLNSAINVKAAKAISPKVTAGKSIHNNTNNNFNNACAASNLPTKQIAQKQLKTNKPTAISTINSSATTAVPLTNNHQQSTPSANVQKQQQQSHILLNQITKPTNSSLSTNNNNCKNSHLKRQNLMLAREAEKTQATVVPPPAPIDKNLGCKSHSPVIRQTQTLQGDHSQRERDIISDKQKLLIQPSQTTQMFQQWHSIPSHQDRQAANSSSTGKRTKQRNNSEQIVAQKQQSQQYYFQATKSIIQEQQSQQLAQRKKTQQTTSLSAGVAGDTTQLKGLSHKNEKTNENTVVTDKTSNTQMKDPCSPSGLFFSDDNKQKILLNNKKFFSLAPPSSSTTAHTLNILGSNTSPSSTDFFNKKQASSTKHASSNTLGNLSNTLAVPPPAASIPSSTHHNGNKSNPLNTNNNYTNQNKPMCGNDNKSLLESHMSKQSRSQVCQGTIENTYKNNINAVKYVTDTALTMKEYRISPSKKRKEDIDKDSADSNQYQLPLKRNNTKATSEGSYQDNSSYINSYNRQPDGQCIQAIIQEIPVGESSNPLSESLSSSSSIPIASDSNQHELSGLQYMSSTMLLRSSSSSREPNRRYERQYSEKQQEINDKIKHILDQRNNSNSAHSQELSWRSPYTLSQELNARQQYPQQLKANCYKTNCKNQENFRESIMMQSIVDTNKEYFNWQSHEQNRNIPTMQGNNNTNNNGRRNNDDDHTPNRNKTDENTTSSVSNSNRKNKIHLKGYSSGQQTAVTPSTCDGKHLNPVHLGSSSSVAVSHFVVSGSSPSNNIQLSTQPYLTTENDDDIRIVLEDQFKTESSQNDCFKTDRTAILTERDLHCRESQLEEFNGVEEGRESEHNRNFSYEEIEEGQDGSKTDGKGNNQDAEQQNDEQCQLTQQISQQKQCEAEGVSVKLEKRLMNLESEMSSVILRCLHLENMNNSLAENVFKISSQRDQILNENEQYRIRITELIATNRLQEDTIAALLGRVQKEEQKGKDLNLSQLKTNRNKTEMSYNNNNMNSTFEGSHHNWDKTMGFCENLSANAAGNTSSHLANSNRINNTTTCCYSGPSTTSAGSRQKKDANQYFSSIIASTQGTNAQAQTFQGYLSQKSAGTLGLADFKQHDYYLSARHGLLNQQTKQ